MKVISREQLTQNMIESTKGKHDNGGTYRYLKKEEVTDEMKTALHIKEKN